MVFPTNDEVDEYSGRGHGLGVIKTKIAELNGSFEINYEKGQFFEMIIKVPTSIKINPKEA